MTPTNPNDGLKRTTESSSASLIEFVDTDLTDLPPDPALAEEAIRRAPSWLRAEAEARGLIPAKQTDPVPLALCLLEQARVLVMLKRHAEAIPKVSEAEKLYEVAGISAGIAECFHVAAGIHRGLGEIEKALDFLRKEEEIRRRLAA
jgi:hypothetical protein